MNTRPTGDDDFADFTGWLGPMGSISELAEVAAGEDRVRQLHEVVAEVTGRPVEPAPKPRIGFLP